MTNNYEINAFAKKYNLSKNQFSLTELKELYQLVEEIREQEFSNSGELSNYITKNRLGSKYRHIAGIVYMENDTSSWQFKGGFPPKIYAIVCQILGLGSKGTRSWVSGYKTYSELGY